MNDEQIKHMRDRFLAWTLPENLNPDGGISYKRPESAIKYNHPGPVGTNFLDAEQAEAMVHHMIEGLPVSDELTTAREIARECIEELKRIENGLHNLCEMGLVRPVQETRKVAQRVRKMIDRAEETLK